MAMRPRASLPPFDTLAGTISQRRELCLILADNAEFRLQPHAGVGLNGLAHPLDEFEDVTGRGRPQVDDETGVALGDLGVPDAKPLASGFLDERTGIAPGRAFEDAPRARKVDGLTGLPLRGVLLLPAPDGGKVPSSESQRRRHDDPALALGTAGPVAELKKAGGDGLDEVPGRDKVRGLDHLRHL